MAKKDWKSAMENVTPMNQKKLSVRKKRKVKHVYEGL